MQIYEWLIVNSSNLPGVFRDLGKALHNFLHVKFIKAEAVYLIQLSCDGYNL